MKMTTRFVLFLAAIAAMGVMAACGAEEGSPAKGSGPKPVDSPSPVTSTASTESPASTDATPETDSDKTTPTSIERFREKASEDSTVAAIQTAAAPSPTPVPTPVVAPAELSLAADGGVFEEMLGFMPDREETRGMVWMNDLGPWWDYIAKLGVERPGPEAPADWRSDFYSRARAATLDDGKSTDRDPFQFRPLKPVPFLCCPLDYISTVQPYPYVGFDMRSVDATLTLADLIPGMFELTLGRYDPEDTASRLEACEECVPHEVVEHSGMEYYSWFGDFRGSIKETLEPPLMDHAGRGGRLLVGDGYAIRTLHDAGIEGMIDAHAGALASLADDPDYLLAARALVGLNAYGAGIAQARTCEHTKNRESVECQGFGPDGIPEDLQDTATSEPLLKPFTAAAAGYAFEAPDDPVHTVLVVVHEDEATAEENAGRLEKRLQILHPREDDDGKISFYEPRFLGASIERAEIGVDGRVVMARLHPRDSDDRALQTRVALVPFGILKAGTVLVHE